MGRSILTERRKSKRSYVNLRGQIVFPPFWGAEEHQVSIRNISTSGLCAEVPFLNLEKGLSVNGEEILELRIPKVLGDGRILGRAIRISLDEQEPKIGIQFVNIDDRAGKLIRNFLTRPSAQRYTIGLYATEWRKSFFSSTVSLIRDLVVGFLPFKLPKAVLWFIYGVEPAFVFYLHPRRKEDIFIALPLFRYMRKLLPSKWILLLASALPPFVLGAVKHKDQDGLIIVTLQLPSDLKDRPITSIRKAKKTISFVGKICSPGTVLGIGGWWPIVTTYGSALQSEAERFKIQITDGHCCTLLSLYLMIEKIIQISGIDKKDFRIGIIGLGAMGQKISLLLNGKIDKLLLIDVNQKRLETVVATLMREQTSTTLETVCAVDGDRALSAAFNQAHLYVCTASNIGKIINDHFLPERIVVIDDSRPEAFTRENPHLGRVIIEGGLIKLRDAVVTYDFGFGSDENVFGCLAESYLLALDRKMNKEAPTLKPTIGDVELDNFWKMKEFCEMNSISVGEFKSGSLYVGDDLIATIIKQKEHELLTI